MISVGDSGKGGMLELTTGRMSRNSPNGEGDRGQNIPHRKNSIHESPVVREGKALEDPRGLEWLK